MNKRGFFVLLYIFQFLQCLNFFIIHFFPQLDFFTRYFILFLYYCEWYCFSFFSVCLLFVYGKPLIVYVWICELIFYCTAFLNVFYQLYVSCRILCIESYYANKNALTYSLLMGMQNSRVTMEISVEFFQKL